MCNKKCLLKRIFLFLIILIFYIFLNPLAAFENEKVHREINKNAVNFSILDPNLENYLKNVLGFSDALDEEFNSKKILEWLQEGGTKEDDPASRCFRHFHDPLRNWSQAGLFTTNLSAIYWAQVPEPEDEFDLTNEFSWSMAKSYFYKALTVPEKNEREDNWAKTFRSLGQVMHLLSDMAVPAHVRNDMHPEVTLKDFFKISHFEIYTEDVYNKFDIMKYDQAIKPDPALFSLAKDDVKAPSSISALFDTDNYSGLNPVVTQDGQPIGLAEFTNANFLSESTIFKSYPYPDLSETDWNEFYLAPEIILSEDLNEEKKLYLYKMFGSVKKIAALSYFYTHVPKTGPVATRTIILDDEVYKTYAGELVPRAVGYSSALLDYFFRGKLEISHPNQFVYAFSDGSSTHQFNSIKANIRNTSHLKDQYGTEIPEEAPSGELIAVVKYRKIIGYLEDLSNYPSNSAELKSMSEDVEFSYSVSAPILIDSIDNSLPTDVAQEFTFDFSGDAVPAGVTDLTLQVIFKGTLGNEADTGIAVGFKDLNEPAHYVYNNSSDEVVMNSELMTAAQIKSDPLLTIQVDWDNDGIFNEVVIDENGVNVGEPYIDPYDISLQIGFSASDPQIDPDSVTEYPIVVDHLPAGRYSRIILLCDVTRGNRFWTEALVSKHLGIETENDISYGEHESVYMYEGNPDWTYTELAPDYNHRGVWQHLLEGNYSCIGEDCPYLGDQRDDLLDLNPFPILP